MRQLAEGVWLDTTPMRIVGTTSSVSMAVLRLPSGGLLLYSPLEMKSERRAAVEALGRVEHLVAPNLFHHLSLAEWAAAFPEATVHAAPGLEKKRPDLRIDRTLGDAPDPGLADVITEVPIDGCRLGEVVLFYRPANTLLVADLVHNVGRPSGWWTRAYTKLAGFYDEVALSRVLRWTAFNDRAAARVSIDRVLGLGFERLMVGHGEPIDAGASSAFERAYDWLAPRAGDREQPNE